MIKFNGIQAKAICLIIADLVEESVKIPVITKKIVNHCRGLAEKTNPEFIYCFQKKAGGPNLFHAKNWEIVEVNPNEPINEGAEDEPKEND